MRRRISLGVSACYICVILSVLISGCSYSTLHKLTLYRAAESNNISGVKQLLQDGENVEKGIYGNITPLCIAASKGHKEVVTILLDAGADVNAKSNKGRTPLTEAIRNKHTEIALILLKHGADPNPSTSATTSNPPLITAIKAANQELAVELISRGADVNYTDKNRQSTPLLEAIKSGNASLIKLLLDKGANIHAATPDGTTALHLAVTVQDLQTVKYCIQNSIDVNVYNDNHDTPLHMAALAGNIEIINFLLGKGAIIKAVNSSGMNLLHLAALGGNVQTVKFLLNKGFKIDSKDANGFTALLMAAQGDNKEMALFLLRNGVGVFALQDFPEPTAKACEMSAEYYAFDKKEEAAEALASASYWYNKASKQYKQLAVEFQDKYKKKVMEEAFWSALAAGMANTAIAYANNVNYNQSRKSAERQIEIYALHHAAENRMNIGGYYAALSSQRVLTIREYRTLDYSYAPSQQTEALGEMLRDYKSKQSLYERKAKECVQKQDCYERCASEQALMECLALIDG